MADQEQEQAEGYDFLSLDDLTAGEPETLEVVLPALKAKVEIRPLTLEETQRLRQEAIKVSGNKSIGFDQVRFYKGAVLASVIKPRLTRAQVDALWLRKASDIKPLIDAIDELNTFGEEAAEDAEAAFPAK